MADILSQEEIDALLEVVDDELFNKISKYLDYHMQNIYSEENLAQNVDERKLKPFIKSINAHKLNYEDFSNIEFRYKDGSDNCSFNIYVNTSFLKKGVKSKFLGMNTAEYTLLFNINKLIFNLQNHIIHHDKLFKPEIFNIENNSLTINEITDVSNSTNDYLIENFQHFKDSINKTYLIKFASKSSLIIGFDEQALSTLFGMMDIKSKEIDKLPHNIEVKLIENEIKSLNNKIKILNKYK